MCGIVGCLTTHKTSSPERIRGLLDVIQYRGPDDSGVYTDQHVGLGHVRLSILDLSKLGAQPMISRSGRYVIAYNGEVYNFAVLRVELDKAGIALKSTGDTEALLEYIAQFGIDRCLELIEGMFAFAVWDRQEQSLILARDRQGIKPLYYTTDTDGDLWFASEFKALLEFSRGPDCTTINAAMLGLGCAYDEHTLLNGIASLRAGESIVFRTNQAPQKRFFFQLPDFIEEAEYHRWEKMKPDEVVHSMHDVFKESMRLCMISDAPVAVLASGGVDSSLIAAMANQAHPNLALFHANVAGASETKAAEALAKHLDCDLFSERVTEQDTLDHTADVTFHYEMPLMYHSNAVPFYLVSRLAARNRIKVVLTGEGSDEYFIGYATMAILPEIQRYRDFLAWTQQRLHRLTRAGKVLWPSVSETLPLQLRDTLFRYELQQRRMEAEEKYRFIKSWRDRLLSYMSLDMCQGNVPPLLHRNDRLGMAWGLESRFPFLSHGVAKAALNLPSKFKVRRTFSFYDKRHPFVIDKWCVRKLAELYLPTSLAHRGKYAFRAPVYSRLALTKSFFANGFVQDFYGLSDKGLEFMVAKSSTTWKSRMFLLEVWGRLFVRREKAADIRLSIARDVSYIP